MNNASKITFVALITMAFSSVLFSQEGIRETVFITGSNRGIGFELVKVFQEEGWNVIATTRNPDTSYDLNAFAKSHNNVFVERLDVTSASDLAQLSERYMGVSIDVIINNAGIYGDRALQEWGSLDSALFHQVMAVNVLAPMLIAETFIENVRASNHKKIISITSGAGSVSIESVSNGGIFYSVSKTALNMAIRKLASEPDNAEILFGLVAPGLTETDMLRVARPELLSRAHSPEESARGIFDVVTNLDSNYDGSPLNYDGSKINW